MLKLAEEPFLTVQGEGRNVGKLCLLVRMEGCNLRCSWCDSSYTWKEKSNSSSSSLSSFSLGSFLREFSNPTHSLRFSILLTGGEPLLQTEEIIKELSSLSFREIFTKSNQIIEIETNGTISPLPFTKIYNELKMSRYQSTGKFLPPICFNVSPKFQNIKYDVLDEFLRFLNSSTIFKFVIGNEEDFQNAQTVIKKLQIPSYLVYLQPLHNRRHSLRKKSLFVLQKCLDYHYNFSPRLQIYLFNDNENQWIAKKKIEYKNLEKLP